MENLVKIGVIIEFLRVFINDWIVGIVILVDIEFVGGIKVILFVCMIGYVVVLGVVCMLVEYVVVVLIKDGLLRIVVVDVVE